MERLMKQKLKIFDIYRIQHETAFSFLISYCNKFMRSSEVTIFVWDK